MEEIMKSTKVSARNLFMQKCPGLSDEDYDLFAQAVIDSEEEAVTDTERIIARAVICHSPESISMIVYCHSMNEAA